MPSFASGTHLTRCDTQWAISKRDHRLIIIIIIITVIVIIVIIIILSVISIIIVLLVTTSMRLESPIRLTI